MEHHAFRTIVTVQPSSKQIDYDSKVLFTGSCFTENVGNKLRYYKFNTIVNPFGILYNPVSVSNSLKSIIEKKIFRKEDLFFHNNLWNSFYHHSRFSHPDQSICLEQINNQVEQAYSLLKEADFLFITFGTAWIYELADTGDIVSNCHKLPASKFNRRRLDTQEIIDLYKNLFQELLSFNPKLNICFTVSPVRHWKDGAVENQLSKAILITAIHAIKDKMKQINYFPAYEILMDDLRDYRFYNEDMLHPNPTAIEYVWKQFKNVFINANCNEIMDQIGKIRQGLAHKPFNPQGPNHQQFLFRLLSDIEALEKLNPALDFTEEKKNLKRQIVE